jgi:uncharacterized damage-inducible protein DinB
VNPLAGLVVESWKDFDRVIEGVSGDEAVAQPDGQSSIAWTLGHVTEHVDRMINVALEGGPRHPLLGDDRFRMGSEGRAEDWDEIVAATEEVREAARLRLESLSEHDLGERYEPPGAISGKLGPVTIRYVLLRIATHHYFHIGVIAVQRDLRGVSVGNYPGLLADANR